MTREQPWNREREETKGRRVREKRENNKNGRNGMHSILPADSLLTLLGVAQTMKKKDVGLHKEETAEKATT